MAKFYQFTPREMYLMVQSKTDETDSETQTLPTNDAICPELLTMFAKNLYKYGIRTLKFHASRLELDPDEFRFSVKALTGQSFTDFAEDFQVLRIRDLLGEYPQWGTIKEKARILGYSSSGLYRFMKRKMKRTPSGWGWSSY